MVSLFEAAVVPNVTKVISLSHVLTTNGLRMPIPQISAMAHKYNISVVVDGAQAPGGIDVDLAELGCDAYATSAHKWMLAPKVSPLSSRPGRSPSYPSARCLRVLDPSSSASRVVCE